MFRRVLIPVGCVEIRTLQATATATPENTQGVTGDRFSISLENLSRTQDPKSLRRKHSDLKLGCNHRRKVEG